MVNKQGLWFLTLFSLILVLGVYYVTMPSEMFSSNNGVLNEDKKEEKEVAKEESTITESNYITALKIELDEAREKLTKTYEETINSKSTTTEEKNNAYEAIKAITSTKGIEENLETKINNKYNVTSFVKCDNEVIEVVVDKKEHDISLANNIMRLVQEEFDNKMTISVKFS